MPDHPRVVRVHLVSVPQEFVLVRHGVPDDPPGGTGGYLDPSDDALNVRPFHMKQRFGLDAQFPIARYIAGLTSYAVPDSATSTTPMATTHRWPPATTRSSRRTCRRGERATFPPRPRAAPAETGVLHRHRRRPPPAPAARIDQSRQPAEDDARCIRLTTVFGNDPLHYDFTGADFHMLESEQPRPGSKCPPTAADDCDPIDGREFDTNKSDLEFACIYPLATQLDCTSPGPGDAYKGACQCATGGLDDNTQLCQKTTAPTRRSKSTGSPSPRSASSRSRAHSARRLSSARLPDPHDRGDARRPALRVPSALVCARRSPLDGFGEVGPVGQEAWVTRPSPAAFRAGAGLC